MKYLMVFLLLACVSICAARDLIVGNTDGARLVWRTKVNAMSFPFKKRVKEIFYSNAEDTRIRGVIVRDLDRTEGAVESITAGGVGFPYANVRLKGARGRSLNYQIEIYI